MEYGEDGLSEHLCYYVIKYVIYGKYDGRKTFIKLDKNIKLYNKISDSLGYKWLQYQLVDIILIILHNVKYKDQMLQLILINVLIISIH